MKDFFKKENIMPKLKKVGTFAIILIALIGGFYMGRNYQPEDEVEVVVPHNPYAHAFTPDEISIAVNESNELIMIERQTGDYIVYSDTVGITIFEMYSNRIYEEAISND